MKKVRYEEVLRRWLNLVGNKDVQYYQDIDWDWEEEIQEFLINPMKALNIAAENNPDICPCCGDPYEKNGGKWEEALHGKALKH
jgi:hypothetical protein